MNDDDQLETQRRNKRRYEMPEEVRDTRRAQTADERAAHRRAHTSGSVQLPDDDEVQTGPVALIDGIELTDEDVRQVNRLRRKSEDPFVFGFKVAKAVYRLDKKEDSNNEQRANQLLELLNRPPHADVAELKRQVAFARKIGAWAITAVFGGLIGGVTYVAEKISSSAERAGVQTEQLRDLERSMRSVEQDIRDLRRDRKDTP